MANFNRTADGDITVTLTTDATEYVPADVGGTVAAVIQMFLDVSLSQVVGLSGTGDIGVQTAAALRLNVPTALAAAGEIGIELAATMHRDNHPEVVRVYSFDNGDVFTFDGDPAHVVVDLSEP